MHVVGGGWIEGGDESGEGTVAIMIAKGGLLRGFFGGGFEFEPWRETGQKAAESFEVGSDGTRLLLAGGGFDGHRAAESTFFEGLQDWVGDQFYLLKPMGAVLLGGRRCVSCVDFSGEGRCGSCSQGAKEKSAAIRV